MNFKDLVAKLLATENITVIRGNAATASFNIQTRVLTLPIWKNLKDDVETMLIAHEVGHALYTPLKHTKELTEDKLLHSWMNVIEDVRIEKAIQNKFPGLQPYFKRAYKQLVDDNFFGLKGRNLSKLMFIDKANLFYKAGYNCGVKFNEKEYSYIKRIDECKSFKDVFKLAKELTGYSKKIKEDELKALEMLAKLYLNSDDIEEDKEQKALAESLKIGLMEDGLESDSNGGSESDASHNAARLPDYKSIQDILNENLEERANGTQFHIVDYSKMTKYVGYNPFVEYKEIFKQADSHKKARIDEFLKMKKDHPNKEYESYAMGLIKSSMENEAKARKDYETFINDSKKEVSYLIKEFEMRKSANQYYKTKQHKSGLIDVKKIFAYKIKDEIFKTIQILPQGKNHGMIMLMDWSGSMSSILEDVVKQTILLTQFCKRINIPFSVIAFTNHLNEQSDIAKKYHDDVRDHYASLGTGVSENLASNYFKCVELFNHTMSKKDYDKMASLLFENVWEWLPNYQLASTPLNESLGFMLEFIPKFKNDYKVHKLSFITLTDGEGHAVAPRNYNPWAGVYKNKLIIKKGNKDYPFDGYLQTGTLIQLIKELDPANITTFNFNLVYDTKRNVAQAISYARAWNEGRRRSCDEAEEILTRKEFKEKGCSIKLGYNNYDEMYMIPLNRLKTENNTIEQGLASGKLKTSHQIAKSFTKLLKRNRSSRFLLNSFAKKVA